MSQIKNFFKGENKLFFLPIAILVFWQLDAIFTWTPFYGQSVKEASAAWWFLAIPLYALSVCSLVVGERSKNGVKPQHVIAAGVFWVLAMAALAGFTLKG
jgi:hypothetical protein